MKRFVTTTTSAGQTRALGESLGTALKGGEVILLSSDIGGGKTTLVKGIAAGMGSTESVQSPTFIISAVYDCSSGRQLYHYDFYRLNDPGVMRDQLAETLQDSNAVTVIEWGEIVSDVTSKEAVTVSIQAISDNERVLAFTIPNSYSHINKAVGSFI